MSLELFGTEVLGRLVLGFVKFIAKKLGISQGFTLLLVLAISTVSLCGFTAYDSTVTSSSLQNERVKAIQTCIGGLGIGAVNTPYWCLNAYDPRLEPQCYCTMEPVPAGYCYCPYHSSLVSYMEEIPPEYPYMEVVVNESIRRGR